MDAQDRQDSIFFDEIVVVKGSSVVTSARSFERNEN